MYIILEGIDTAGKSTQLDILKKTYPNAIFTKEPGGTDIGIDIRNMVLNTKAQSKLAEMFLFLADRAEHYEKVIQPNSNKIIISDRGFISGIAYAKDFELDMILNLNQIALKNQMPDCVIMLELSPKELKYRLSQKKNDGIELRGIDYLLDIQNRMKIVLSKLNIPTLIIDANEEILNISKQIEQFIEGVKQNG